MPRLRTIPGYTTDSMRPPDPLETARVAITRLDPTSSPFIVLMGRAHGKSVLSQLVAYDWAMRQEPLVVVGKGNQTP